MVRRRASWAALIAVVASGCTMREHLGGPAACARSCDAGSPMSWPITDAGFPDFDERALERVSKQVSGKWYGLAAGFENLGPPFSMTFTPDGGTGSGGFLVHCFQKGSCVPFGGFESPSVSRGNYQIVYVDSQSVGEGELLWNSFGALHSAKVRNLLLSGDEQVLSFYTELGITTVQVVLTRNPGALFEDGGTPIDAGPSSDAGSAP